MSGEAPISCVVISLRAQRGLPHAVRSLLHQDPVPEIVVVNSGGGGPDRLLADHGIEGIRVVDVPERLYVGAARNIGVRETSAPIVSFLAADCIAEPDWTAARLRRHDQGADAVACSVTNATPGSAIAMASYLQLFHTRMPAAQGSRAKCYGLSFRRVVLEDAGPYREDLRVGEDSELTDRLPPDLTITWAPEVRTAHAHPTGVWSAVREHQARGRRSGRANAEVRNLAPWRTALEHLGSLRASTGAGWAAAVDRDARLGMLQALPLMVLLAAAYAAGALRPYPQVPAR